MLDVGECPHGYILDTCDECEAAKAAEIATLRAALEAAEKGRAEAESREAEALDGRAHVSAGELRRLGGDWLGAARSWLQHHTRNGERVTWGSHDRIEHSFTVADVEDLAADVAAAAMRPQPNEKRVTACLRARWNAERERDTLRARIAALEEIVGAARDVERSGKRYGSVFVEVPIALFHTLRDKLVLLRGEQPACGTCGGSKRVTIGSGEFSVNEPCDACSAPCGTCGGTRVVHEDDEFGPAAYRCPTCSSGAAGKKEG